MLKPLLISEAIADVLFLLAMLAGRMARDKDVKNELTLLDWHHKYLGTGLTILVLLLSASWKAAVCVVIAQLIGWDDSVQHVVQAITDTPWHSPLRRVFDLAYARWAWIRWLTARLDGLFRSPATRTPVLLALLLLPPAAPHPPRPRVAIHGPVGVAPGDSLKYTVNLTDTAAAVTSYTLTIVASQTNGVWTGLPNGVTVPAGAVGAAPGTFAFTAVAIPWDSVTFCYGAVAHSATQASAPTSGCWRVKHKKALPPPTVTIDSSATVTGMLVPSGPPGNYAIVQQIPQTPFMQACPVGATCGWVQECNRLTSGALDVAPDSLLIVGGIPNAPFCSGARPQACSERRICWEGPGISPYGDPPYQGG
jgi:hypothetical protein